MSDLTRRCSRIQVFFTDVDGVLTDAGMYYGEKGDEFKKFSTWDGGGLMLLRMVGIRTGFITGEKTELVARRAKKLSVDHVFQGVKNKLGILESLEKDGIDPSTVAYIGDDINDVPILERVGVSATVPDNWLPRGFSVDYTTTRPGGHGAVREFAEWLLRERSEYDKALKIYLDGVADSRP